MPSHDGTVDSCPSIGQTLAVLMLRISSFACLLLHYFLRLHLFSFFALPFRYCVLTFSHSHERWLSLHFRFVQHIVERTSEKSEGQHLGRYGQFCINLL